MRKSGIFRTHPFSMILVSPAQYPKGRPENVVFNRKNYCYHSTSPNGLWRYQIKDNISASKYIGIAGSAL